MKQSWQHITQSGQCPTIDNLILYHKGKLSKEENFAIENHLASCGICIDLLEGIIALENIDSLDNIENEIKQNIHNKLFKKNSKTVILPLYQKIAIAASILILIGISIVIYRSIEVPEKHIAQTLPKPSSQVMEKSVAKQDEKKGPINENKGLGNKINSPVKAKENKNASAMSEIQFEESSGNNMAHKTSQPETAGTLMINTPLAITSDKVVSEPDNDDYKKEKAEFKVEKGAKIEHRSLISVNKEITGIVTDERGEPLPGANVSIKGTSKGVVSDHDGKFKIARKTPNDKLNISFVGYKSQELTAENESDIKITLEPETVALNEVVVTGYGIQKNSLATASVSSVERKDLNEKQHESEIQIDSLENKLKSGYQQKAIIKSLVEKYLEIQNKEEALEKLDSLYEQTTDMEQKKNIDEIIQLTREEKYSKALKKLKKLK